METRGKLDKIDAAYIAGFVDGEGCLSVYRKKPDKPTWSEGYQIYLGISQNSDEVLYWIQDKLGGLGSIHTQKRYSDKHKEGHVLVARGAISVMKIVKEIEPYLIVKKEQAKLMIEFCEHVTKMTADKRRKYRGKNIPPEEIEWRRRYFEKFKKLNH